MNTFITYLKKTALLLLVTFTLYGCGKNDEEPGSAGLNASPTVSSPNVLEDEGIEDGLDDDDSSDDRSEDSAEEKEETEDKENSATYSLPENTTLFSQQCFLNKEASIEYETSIYSMGKIRFNGNGKGKYSYRLFEDDTCEREIEKEQMHFTYSISKTHDRVMVIFVKIKNKKNERQYWLNVIPASNGVFIDLDATQTESSPYFMEPNEKETANFSQSAEEYGVFFEKKAR